MTDPSKSKGAPMAHSAVQYLTSEMWRSFVSNAPVFATVVDAEGRIQFLNRAAPGMTIAEAIGRTVYEFLEPEYVETARTAIAQAHRRGIPTTYECIGAGPHGESAWYETHVGPVQVNGDIVAVSLISTDITQRKAAEQKLRQLHAELERLVAQRTAELRESNEQLRQSEARYRALVESSPDAVIMMDLNGRLEFVSQCTAQMVGYQEPSEVVGRTAMEFVVEGQRARLRDNLRSLVTQGVRENSEYVLVRRDGTELPVESSSAVIRDGNGRPAALMAVFRDITERKEAQEALLRMVQASDRERELITYELHDGVTQQLLAALMYFEAAERAIGSISATAQRDYKRGLAALHKALNEARRLMNRTQTPVFQKFGIAVAIADYIDQFDQPDAPEITFYCDDPVPPLEPLVETALFRVAQEAINNACRHSRSEVVRVMLASVGQCVVLEVQDDGIGFEPDRSHPGRFGLNGIRQRVHLLGKEIRIDSAPGKGTRIRATFPVAADKDANIARHG